MPIDYRILSDRSLVYARGHGVVTTDDIRAHEEALAADPAYRPPMTRIVDYLDIEGHIVPSGDLQDISEGRGRRMEKFGGEHLVFVVVDPLVHARVRQTKVYLEESGFRVDQVRTLSEALDLVGVSEEELLGDGAEGYSQARPSPASD